MRNREENGEKDGEGDGEDDGEGGRRGGDGSKGDRLAPWTRKRAENERRAAVLRGR